MGENEREREREREHRRKEHKRGGERKVGERIPSYGILGKEFAKGGCSLLKHIVDETDVHIVANRRNASSEV